jgi:hypothetical protein
LSLKQLQLEPDCFAYRLGVPEFHDLTRLLLEKRWKDKLDWADAVARSHLYRREVLLAEELKNGNWRAIPSSNSAFSFSFDPKSHYERSKFHPNGKLLHVYHSNFHKYARNDFGYIINEYPRLVLAELENVLQIVELEFGIKCYSQDSDVLLCWDLFSNVPLRQLKDGFPVGDLYYNLRDLPIVKNRSSWTLSAALGGDMPLCLGQRQVLAYSILPQAITFLGRHPQSLLSLTPAEFESLVANRLEAAGCSVYQVGRTNQSDGGIDFLAWKPNGGAIFAVQAKHHSRRELKTGPSDIRDVRGVLANHPIQLGMIITNTEFTPDAIQLAKQLPNVLELRDRNDMAKWLLNDFLDAFELRSFPDEIELAPGVRIPIRDLMKSNVKIE